jgi:hypothetical protein
MANAHRDDNWSVRHTALFQFAFFPLAQPDAISIEMPVHLNKNTLTLIQETAFVYISLLA